MENEQQKLQQKIDELETKLQNMELKLSTHQHDDIDGTTTLRKEVRIDRDQVAVIGVSNHGSAIFDLASGQRQYQYIISTTPDYAHNNIVSESNGMQIEMIHNPSDAFSNFDAIRSPIVTTLAGVTISTTSGGNTVTINGYGFDTNELAGAFISIYDSSGSLVEGQTIASNTSTVITISGTWTSSTSGGTFLIYKPVLLGAIDRVWQRLYVQEGDGGGVRFGAGPTNGGQNGLLYMDSAGDLYWRNKAGTAVKLN